MTSIRPLAEVADVFNGKTPSKTEQRTEGHPVLKIKDVSATGGFKGKFESFVEPTLAAKHQSRWVRSGDSLILNAAHNADYVASKMFFAGISVEGALPTGEWLIVRAKPELVLPAYIHFLLRSPGTRKTIKFMVKGIHLYPKDVATLPVPIPSLDEQRRIVDLLSRAEGIVRLRREAERKAAELVPGIFLEMFGDPATNPKGWDAAPLGELCEIKGGGTPSKQNPDFWIGEIPWVSPKDMSGIDFIVDAEDHISSNAVKGSATNLIPVGSVLIVTRSGVLKHTIPCAITAREVAINQDIKAFVPRARIAHHFLLSQIQIRSKEILGLVRVGATVQNIETESLRRMRFICPSFENQIKFSDKWEQVRSIQAQQAAATVKAEATFSALLGQVFSAN
jgi:type I restriction enzyme S subunit